MTDRLLDRAAGGSRRRAVDALVVHRHDVWVLVGRDDEDAVGLLLGAGDSGEHPLRICRAVLGRDHILLGQPDPDHDRLLSDLLDGEQGGRA